MRSVRHMKEYYYYMRRPIGEEYAAHGEDLLLHGGGL